MIPRRTTPVNAITLGLLCMAPIACLAMVALTFSFGLQYPFSDPKPLPLVLVGTLLLLPATWGLFHSHRDAASRLFMSGAIGLLLVQAVGLAQMSNVFEGTKGLSFTAGVIGLGFATAASASAGAQPLRRAHFTLSLLLGAIAACGILQRLGFEPLTALVSPHRRISMQSHYPGATFGNANFAAALVTPLSVYVLGQTSSQKGRCGRAAGWTAATLGIVFIAISGSRGGLLALLVGLATLAVPYARNQDGHSRRTVAIVISVILGLVVLSSLPGGGLGRLKEIGSSAQTDTASYRVQIWRATTHLWLEKPILGHGPWSFDLEIPRFVDARIADFQTGIFGNERINRAHNDYLNLLADSGLLGLGAFLLVVCSAFMAVRRSPSGVGLPTAAGLAAILTHALLDFPLHMPASAALFWILTGSVVGASTHSKQDAPVANQGWVGLLAAAIASFLLAALATVPWARYIESQRHIRDAMSREASARHSAAIESIRQALAIAPDNREAYAKGLPILNRAHATTAALEAATTWLKLEPNYSDAHNHLGFALLELARNEDAAKSFEKAVSLNPCNLAARLNLAGLQYLQGNYAAAYAHYAGVETVNPEALSDSLRAYAESAARSHQPDAARILDSYLQRSPDDSEMRTLRTSLDSN